MSNPDRCKQMAKEVQADLTAESKRDAKGCDWDVYQRECDKNEGLEYEVEELKAKVAELQQKVLTNEMMNKIRGDI